VAVADTPFGTRAVGISDDRFKTRYILDIGPRGEMAMRATARLTDTDVSFYSSIALSPQGNVGFTLVHSSNLTAGRELVAFSLGMKECNGRRYIVFNRGFSPMTLAVIDATDPGIYSR
jgi:hypothetical protein